jgi:rod shape-determining protein MreC
MLFVWFMMAGFILLFCPQALTSKFQFAFARIFHWPLRIGSNVPLSAKTEVTPPKQDKVAPDGQDGDFSHKELQYQNYIQNLEEELHQKNQLVEQLTGLRTRLRGLEGAKLVPADIITASTEGQRGELIINRGSEDGLAKDLFVIGDNSVIGTITDLSARTAKVRLFTDTSSVIQVNISGQETNMIMQGAGRNQAKIKLVPVKHKIKIGDAVMTRRKPGYLDISMIAGAVQQCKRDGKNAALWDITVKPVCDIAKLNNVAVIVANPPTNMKTGSGR